MTAVSIHTEDGIDLQGVWDIPSEPVRVAVVCHPHPMHGGTMHAPLIRSIAGHLVNRRWAVLRFNFRGVGGSGGTWGGGTDEVGDVGAAVATATKAFPELPAGICGWSFGAATSLRWQAGAGSTLPYVGIAPPVSSALTPLLPEPSSLVPASRLFILGDRDQFVSANDLAAYAQSISAQFRLLKGSDHFFYYRDQQVAELVAGGLAGNGASA